MTDRYVDSSIAYQGRGRNQPVGEVAGLNKWATGGLEPDLTILLDLPPQDGLVRRSVSADRLEAEPADFHERVREGFLAQAQANPDRYLVLDATQAAGRTERPDPGPAPRRAARSGAARRRGRHREFPGDRRMSGFTMLNDEAPGAPAPGGPVPGDPMAGVSPGDPRPGRRPAW